MFLQADKNMYCASAERRQQGADAATVLLDDKDALLSHQA